MAILTNQEEDKIRNVIERKANEAGVPITWVKAQLNNAAQAIEDVITGRAAAISLAIDTAMSPIVLTNPQKRFLVGKVLETKFQRDR